MWTQQKSGDGRTGDSQAAPRVPRTAAPPASGTPPHALLAFQQSAGNAATAQALRQGQESGARRPGRPIPFTPLPTIDEWFPGMVLPSYLMDLAAGGLSTAYGSAGHEFVKTEVASVVGHEDGTVADIAAELAGRPETFFGQGRAFAVEGTKGKDWWDVTVSIAPAPDDRPPAFYPNELAEEALPDSHGAPPVPLEDPEGKDTKVDVQHNTAATAGTTAGASSSKGAGGLAFGLAPVAPGLWLGGAARRRAPGPWWPGRGCG
ncbi:hypothetical protein ABZY09_18845 [Streptomyces sp. NPDC002928]|uniref:hypothetical protein n=1 Tax=Streptomyces sp. NPDC002928 TaxID=3154440 RepID=UPI0033AC06B0